MAKWNCSTSTLSSSTLCLTALCWCSLQLIFLCPFQLRHLTLSLSFKGIKLVGKVTSFFICSPKNSVNRLLHCVSTGCCVHICKPKRNGWHICERFLPKSCLWLSCIFHCRDKTCGWRQAGDCFSYYRLGMDISIMSLFVIHDNTTLNWGRENIPS